MFHDASPDAGITDEKEAVHLAIIAHRLNTEKTLTLLPIYPRAPQPPLFSRSLPIHPTNCIPAEYGRYALCFISQQPCQKLPNGDSMKTSLSLKLVGAVMFTLSFQSTAFGQQSCPVMTDAFLSLARAAGNLQSTRFPDASDIRASQILVQGAAMEIRAAMVAQDCELPLSNPLPRFIQPREYQGRCPVINSAMAFLSRAQQDFKGVRKIFSEAVKHPASDVQNTSDILAGFSIQQNCGN